MSRLARSGPGGEPGPLVDVAGDGPLVGDDCSADSVSEAVTAWGHRIRPHLVLAVQHIVAAGKGLIDAKATLPHGQFGALLEHLGLNRRTAQRFMAIARHPVLSDATHGSHLPTSLRTLDELTRVPDYVLIQAINDRALTSATTRREAVELGAGERTAPAEASGETLRVQSLRESAAFLDMVAREVTMLIIETDAGLHGPPVQVRDSQLGITNLLFLALLLDDPPEKCSVILREIVAELGRFASWADNHPSWVTACAWLATLDEPDIACPWGEQLTGDAADLHAAATTFVWNGAEHERRFAS